MTAREEGPVAARKGGPEMTQIKLDAMLSSQLHDVSEVVELCDPSGRVLGKFLPTADMSQWEPLSPEVSEEELDRREQSTEWYTTDQVLAHLRDLEKR
jgi:hypothetical protein